VTETGPLDLDADLAGVGDDIRRRILMTLSCRDSDRLARVDGAGETFDRSGSRVQRMFNGVLVEEGGYYGDLITPIIKGLRGVHEPQEEVVVDTILRRLGEERRSSVVDHAPFAIELGSYWAYYSIWFCMALDDARAVAMEPDPAYMEVGRRNAELNAVSDRVMFVNGGIGGEPGAEISFTAESDGQERRVPSHDLASLMRLLDVGAVDVVYCDIQGHESELLERGRQVLASGSVRFLVISTHHSSISGDPLTHQKTLALLDVLGAHIIAEHTVSESYSGDGLVVASFDERDRDLVVEVSHARAKDSLFGELEFEVNHYLRMRESDADNAARLHRRVATLTGEVAALTAELASIQNTKLWRWSSPARRWYGSLRSRKSRPLTPSRRDPAGEGH
jgi:FkbM family methyltransferase